MEVSHSTRKFESFISMCFFNPKKLPKRSIFEEEDLNNGNNGNLWIFL